MLFLFIAFVLAVAGLATATGKVLVPRWLERKALAAKEAFAKETDRLEQVCEIGPYSALAKAMAAEEERERQAAINARKREINEIRWQAKKERAAALAEEGERRRKELEEARVCKDGGEHMVSSYKMECQICRKPYNPFVPRGYGDKYYSSEPGWQQAEQNAARRQRYITAGYIEKATARVSNEMVNELLEIMEKDRQISDRLNVVMQQEWRRKRGW